MSRGSLAIVFPSLVVIDFQKVGLFGQWLHVAVCTKPTGKQGLPFVAISW